MIPDPRHPGGTTQGALLIAVATCVNELTRPIPHKAAYDTYDQKGHRKKTWEHHTVQPSLLDQLRAGMPPTRGPDGGSAGGAYESRLPLNPGALECLIRIETQADAWVRECDIRPRATVELNLRVLVGAAGGMPDDRLVLLAAAVRRWHAFARAVTGWDAPPYRPHVTCPACDRRGGLRIRLDEQTGACVLCGSVWAAGTLGILAEHIRQARRDTPHVAP